MEIIESILEILKWPFAAVIIALFFRKPISGLINRTKSIKGGKYGFDTETTPQQKSSDSLLKDQESKTDSIEKGLNLFNEETRKKFQDAIKQETEWENLTSYEQKVKTLFKYSEALYLILYFERIYNLIFGSQIILLNYLNSSQNKNTSSIKFIYDHAVKLNPNLETYSYKKYLEFLSSRNLIEIVNENSIHITWLGRDFLKFMIQMGLSDLKMN